MYKEEENGINTQPTRKSRGKSANKKYYRNKLKLNHYEANFNTQRF